jgi:hypothetical protein
MLLYKFHKLKSTSSMRYPKTNQFSICWKMKTQLLRSLMQKRIDFLFGDTRKRSYIYKSSNKILLYNKFHKLKKQKLWLYSIQIQSHFQSETCKHSSWVV